MQRVRRVLRRNFKRTKEYSVREKIAFVFFSVVLLLLIRIVAKFFLSMIFPGKDGLISELYNSAQMKMPEPVRITTFLFSTSLLRF